MTNQRHRCHYIIMTPYTVLTDGYATVVNDVISYLALTHKDVEVVNDDDIRKKGLRMNVTTPLHNLLDLLRVPVEIHAAVSNTGNSYPPAFY